MCLRAARAALFSTSSREGAEGVGGVRIRAMALERSHDGREDCQASGAIAWPMVRQPAVRVTKAVT